MLHLIIESLCQCNLPQFENAQYEYERGSITQLQTYKAHFEHEGKRECDSLNRSGMRLRVIVDEKERANREKRLWEDEIVHSWEVA